jgi:hypothetical protein
LPRCRCQLLPVGIKCRRCEGAVDPHRDLCASCRRKAKFAYLQAQRQAVGVAGNSAAPGGHVMVQIHGRAFGGLTPPPVVAPPNRCLTCGGDAGASRYAAAPVCERCMVNLPMHVLEASVRRLHESGHPEGCGCERCYGQGKANWQRGACPQCQGTLDPNGGCQSCRYTSGLVSQFATPMHHFGTGPILRSASMGAFPMWGAGGHGGHVGTMGVFARGGVIPSPEPVKQEPFSMEEPDTERAPDLIEPILAWRGWNVTPDGHLVAAATDGIWDAGPNKAVCHGGPNHTDVPAVGCNCGFYGWHETKDIAHGTMWGGFKAWGEIVVHDCGIRAEYAEIIVLIDRHETDPELLARVVDRYKVPVVETLEEAEKVAEGQGILCPVDMRPETPEGAGGQSLQQVGANLAALTQMGIPAAEAAQKMAEAMGQIGKAANASMQSFSGVLVSYLDPPPTRWQRLRRNRPFLLGVIAGVIVGFYFLIFFGVMALLNALGVAQ